MTPDELRSELERLRSEAAAREVQAKAPPPPRPVPRPSALAEYWRRGAEKERKRSLLAEADLNRTTPSVDHTPDQITPGELPAEAAAVDWDADQAEQLGLSDLAAELRKLKGTASSSESHPVAAGQLVELPMQKPYGRFGSSPKLVQQELEYANIKKILRRRGVDNFYRLPPEEQESIRSIAADQAKRTVAGIIGAQEQRGNVLVDLDPEGTVNKIRRGETAMGFLSGQYLGAKVEGLARGIAPEDTLYSRVMSPFTALFVSGGRSVQPQTERPVLGMQKESKLSWFLRLAPSTAIGSWLFDDDGIEWGSDDHIRKIYSGGYDVTQEVRDFGETYARATPWVDSDLAKKIAGFGMVVPIIMLEPDATALVAGPVGKLGKGIAKAASPTKLLIKGVLRPQIKAWTRAIDAATDAAGKIDLSRVERALNLRAWTPSWLMWRAAKGELAARMMAEGVPVWDVKASSDLNYIRQAAQTAEELTARAGKALMSAGRAARGVVSTKRLASALGGLVERRDAWIKSLVDIAEAESADLAEVLRKGGSEAADALERLTRARGAYDRKLARLQELRTQQQLESYLRGRRPGVFKHQAEMEALARDLHRYRGSLVARLPETALASGVAHFRLFNDAVMEAAAKVESALGRSAEEVGGELGAALKSAKESSAAADILLKEARSASTSKEADDAMRALEATSAAYKAKKRASDIASRPAALLKQILSRFDRAAEATLKAMDEGTLRSRPLRYAGSEIQKMRDSGEQIIPETFVSRLMERYGPEAVEYAVSATPEGGYLLSGTTKIADQHINGLRLIEASAHGFLESGRLAEMAPIQMLLESTARIPKWGRAFTLEGWLTSTLKLTKTMERIFDPILSRGLGGAPKLIREIYRRSFEKMSTLEMEANALAKEAVDRGESGISAVIRYLSEYARGTVAESVTAANRDTLTPADKALAYLRAVMNAGEEAFANDFAVRALAWSALPSGSRGELGAVAGVSKLRQFVEEASGGRDFLARVQSEVEAAVKASELSIDASQVTARFISRGTMWASVQHDAMWDLLRAQGGGVSTDVANTLNFFTDVRTSSVLDKAALEESVNEMYRVAAAYNLPLTQEVLTGKASSLRTFFGGVAERNELLKVAEIEGKGLWMPAHIKTAMEGIPRRLVKELEQFDQPSNPIVRTINKLLSVWRVSAVNGWILPRPAFFVATFMGDLSQISAAVGYRPAARISAQTAIAYIPFVGPRIQDRIAAASRGRSVLSGLVNPQLSRVMNAGVDVIETADGPLTSRVLLNEAHADGMLDSISTDVLMEISRRVPTSRWREVFSLSRPLPWIERSARFLEAVQHRIRVQTYLEARTGKLTGTPLPRSEAAAITREALFDWRLGVPRWEAETIGRVFAFWTYKRNMLRQLGASLTESFSSPGSEYFWKAISGRTKLGRMRQIGQLLSAVPETIYWTDEDQLLTEDEQVREFGRRMAPWWVDAEPILANRELSGPRREWYSEVRGKATTMESLVLPALTTMDALSTMNLIANTSMASTVMLAEAAGLSPRLTTADAASIWERNVDAFGEAAYPGFGEVLTNALRPMFGRAPHRSVRGTTVPVATAVTITSMEASVMARLGWGDFIGTYKDKSGRLRYHADPTALQMLGRIVAASPPGAEIARNWVNMFDNPGYQTSITSGVLEGFVRTSGFIRYADLSPMDTVEWATVSKENQMREAIKRAESFGAQR